MIEPDVSVRLEGSFGERLVAQGMITPTQLREALLQQPASGKRLGNLLVELGALDDRDLARELAREFDLPLADLRRLQSETPALQLVPEPVALSSVALPLRLVDERLEIVVADPLDDAGIDAIEEVAGREASLLVAPASDILRAVATAYRSLVADVDRLVEAFEAVEALRRTVETVSAAQDDDDAPIVQLVTQLITQALRDRASDVHIEPQNDRVRIRYRIDGALHDVLALPAAMGPALVSRIKIMAQHEHRRAAPPAGRPDRADVDGRQLDVRVNTCPTI